VQNPIATELKSSTSEIRVLTVYDWSAVGTIARIPALEDTTTYCLPKLLELCSGFELISEVSSHEESYKVPRVEVCRWR
jgi:hypothetical protein